MRREIKMKYYFDVYDGADVSMDETGIELPDNAAAKLQATIALTDMARDDPPIDGNKRNLSIHVRTDDGPMFDVSLEYDVQFSRANPRPD